MWTTDEHVPLLTQIVGFLLEWTGVAILFLFAAWLTWVLTARRRPGTPFPNYVPASIVTVIVAFQTYRRSISIIGPRDFFGYEPAMVCALPHAFAIVFAVFPAIWGLSVLVSARIQAPRIPIDRSRLTWAMVVAGAGIILWLLADDWLASAAQALHKSCN